MPWTRHRKQCGGTPARARGKVRRLEREQTQSAGREISRTPPAPPRSRPPRSPTLDCPPSLSNPPTPRCLVSQVSADKNGSGAAARVRVRGGRANLCAARQDRPPCRPRSSTFQRSFPARGGVHTVGERAPAPPFPSGRASEIQGQSHSSPPPSGGGAGGNGSAPESQTHLGSSLVALHPQ